jgi:hypothetical protein
MTERRRPRARIGGFATVLAVTLSTGWVCVGCAAARRQVAPPPAAAARASGIDCDFLAPTSCWTLGPRFPPTRAEPPDSAIDEPPVLVDASK